MDPLGRRMDPLGERGPLMQALFGKNVCKMKELGPVGGHAPSMPPLDPPMELGLINMNFWYHITKLT